MSNFEIYFRIACLVFYEEDKQKNFSGLVW